MCVKHKPLINKNIRIFKINKTPILKMRILLTISALRICGAWLASIASRGALTMGVLHCSCTRIIASGFFLYGGIDPTVPRP